MISRTKRRRQLTHEELDRRRQNRVMIFGIFMILLMIFSVASVINYSPDSTNQMRYGDYEFVLETRTGGGSVLTTKLDGRTVEFQNLPVQVAYLEVDPTAIPTLQNAQQIALTSDVQEDVQAGALIDYARLQMGIAIPKSFNAISTPHPEYVLPALSCEQATNQVPVVTFNITNETARITTTGACVILHGNNQDLMRLKDRLIFEYYNILRNGEVVDE